MPKKKPHWSETKVTERDQEIIDSAKYFTTFRFGGIGKRLRKEFPTLAKARQDVDLGGRALVYAVSENNLTALVPSSYEPQ